MNNTKLPQFKYETPINNNRYHQLCQGYNSNNYQIMNELPVTAAGLMPHGDEDDDDIHIGDRRIGDPYLNLLRDDDNHCDQKLMMMVINYEKYISKRIDYHYRHLIFIN